MPGGGAHLGRQAQLTDTTRRAPLAQQGAERTSHTVAHDRDYLRRGGVDRFPDEESTGNPRNVRIGACCRSLTNPPWAPKGASESATRAAAANLQPICCVPAA